MECPLAWRAEGGSWSGAQDRERRRIGPGLVSERLRHCPKITLGVEADCGGAFVELLQELLSGSTGLQIVYPATPPVSRAGPRRSLSCNARRPLFRRSVEMIFHKRGS